MKFLVLGAGGMAGHLITIYLKEKGEDVIGLATRNLSYCNSIVMDVTDFLKLEEIILKNHFDIIINCVGILNQTAEANIDQAILINSYLPHYLEKITTNIPTRIIHMSTDCVFSGKKGSYIESDLPDGESVYDRTKALGELNDNKNLTFRNSIIGPDIKCQGIGLFNWFMKQSETITGYDKSIWNGVTTLTLAKAIHAAAYTNLSGIYHLVNNKTITKYELLLLFKKYFNPNIEIIKVDGVNQDKSLINSRLDFKYIIQDYETQVEEMYDWVMQHAEVYQHYSLKGN